MLNCRDAPAFLALALLAAGILGGIGGPRVAHYGRSLERGRRARLRRLCDGALSGSPAATRRKAASRSSANPWRGSDGDFTRYRRPFARPALLTRGYYAWKNGLPRLSQVRGGRFSVDGNQVADRVSITDRGRGIDAGRVLRAMSGHGLFPPPSASIPAVLTASRPALFPGAAAGQHPSRHRDL